MAEGSLYVDVTVREEEQVDVKVSDLVEAPETGEGGTSDYNKLKNLPKLNGKTIKGNMEFAAQDFGGVSEETYTADLQAIESRINEMVPADSVVPVEAVERMYSGIAPAAEGGTADVSFVDYEGLNRSAQITLGLLEPKADRESVDTSVAALNAHISEVSGSVDILSSEVENGLKTANTAILGVSQDLDALEQKVNNLPQGGSITVDGAMSETSENPVQNKAILAQIRHVETGLSGLIAENLSLLNTKADKDSPELTGTPTAPTPEPGDSTDRLATTKFVQLAVSRIPSGEFELIKVVSALPESGEPNKIYLVPTGTETGNNKFNEFMWVNGAWEYIGAQELSLEGYVKKTDFSEITFEDINAMFGKA